MASTRGANGRSQTATTPPSTAANTPSAPPTRTRKVGKRRPRHELLAEAEARVQRLRDEEFRASFEPFKEDELIHQLATKISRVQYCKNLFREMGLDEAACDEAIQDMRTALAERLEAIKADKTVFKQRKHKDEKTGTNTGTEATTSPDVGPFP
jgi:hypothetical protein